MRHAVVVALTLVVVACRTRAPSSDAPDAAAPPVVTASVSASASAAPAPTTKSKAPSDEESDAGTCDPSQVPKVLARIACKPESYIASRQVGFSKDGRYLGMCVSRCDPCPSSCDFDDAVGKRRVNVRFSYGPDMAGYEKLSEEELHKRMEAQDARTQKFLDDGGFAPLGEGARTLTGTWPYPDMVLASRSEAPEKDGTAVLELGASVDDAEPVYPIRIVMGPQSLWRDAPKQVLPNVTGKEREDAIASIRSNFVLSVPQLAYVDLSPDGKDLGVVAFTTGSMWYEDAKWVRMPVKAFAGAVYRETAAALRKKGDTAKAAALVDKAAALK